MQTTQRWDTDQQTQKADRYTLITNRTLLHLGPHFNTFISHNATSTPDIILSNTHTYHNLHATQGPITTSDHIPIIVKIATTPIVEEMALRPNFRRADWESFQSELEEKFRTPMP